jgi:hypothetical protein
MTYDEALHELIEAKQNGNDVWDTYYMQNYEVIYNITEEFKTAISNDIDSRFNDVVAEIMEYCLFEELQEQGGSSNSWGYSYASIYDCVYKCEWEVNQYDDELSIDVVNVKFEVDLKVKLEKRGSLND